MSEISTEGGALAAAPGLSMTQRRTLFAGLVTATTIALLWLMAFALSPGGLSGIDLVLLGLFALTLPWLVIGFWNAVIGYLIMRFSADPVAAVTPAAARIRGDEPIATSTALLVCVRNEMPDRVIRNLRPIIEGLVHSGNASHFHMYVLSDTDDLAVAAAEEKDFGALAASFGGKLDVNYRRRTVNTGFKAGNIRDCFERWGANHQFAIVLDTDSFMSARAMLRLVRVMQANPNLGILQSLVVGLPSTSAFARIFQFGMRLGMRSYTTGSAWWQGDCGPYWGHNAIIRIAPFMAHCQLPELPKGSLLGDHVLSHDQIEATLMRRAGYEVRVLPREDQSWEENPPTLIEFVRRDLRWCQGNMQYWHFLTLPGLKPVSRYQLTFAILMFIGSPAWIGLLVVGTLAAFLAEPDADLIVPEAGIAVFWTVFVMWISPKLATILYVLPRARARKAFGGLARFLASVAVETIFFVLLMPIMWFRHSVFLAGLLFGKKIGWIGQTRDDHAVPFALAARTLWPQTMLGIAMIALLAATHPAALPYALFIAAGLALSIPLAVITALPRVGQLLARVGIGRLPEETRPPAELYDLALPALDLVGAPPAQPRAA
jgi:membrane glycosyltransferase